MTEQRLKVIAFISGGKDSFFSSLHCIANGHKIIAWANLFPPSLKDQAEETSDLNSHMYQTVGHSLVPLYAQMSSVPLYRQEIHGTALDRAKDYQAPERSSMEGVTASAMIGEDETESMMNLLHHIKTHHPEANAVCSGAILSTYQRTRIESVALRMQLVPLAYLWQYPHLPTPEPRRDGLLQDMAAVGLDARIIKVASGGLDESLLWENVCGKAIRSRLARAMARFGGSVLGEGGEFETLVVDGPAPVFNGAMEIRVEQMKVIQGGAGEFWMTFTGGAIRKKGQKQSQEDGWMEKLRVPDLLDPVFRRILETVDKETCHRSTTNNFGDLVNWGSSSKSEWHDQYHICSGRWTSRISNVSASYVGNNTEAQIERIRYVVLSILEELQCSVHDTIFTTILLRSMDDFYVVNGKYAELFSSGPNPPARVTIACGDTLPQGVNVMVSLVVSHDADDFRRCLHVQSRSYWAPANIGPYSQAKSVRLENDGVGALVYVAGQIPLVPASMEVITRASLPGDATSISSLAGFRLQSTLSLQHLWRIGKVMDVGWWTGALAFLVADDHNDISSKVSISISTWRAIHIQVYRHGQGSLGTAAGDDDFDVWHQQRNNGPNFQVEDEEHDVPDFSCLSVLGTGDVESQDVSGVIPPLFAVEVAQLPRNSEIEWQALGVSQTPVKFLTTIWEYGISVTACTMASNEIVFGFIGIKIVDTMTTIEAQIEQSLRLLQRRCDGANLVDGHKIIYTSYSINGINIKAQLVPCKSVWNFQGESLAAAIVLHYEVGDMSQISNHR
ncbi:MAG: hypothetical protein Q9170_000040 [Blastenia crenularia]